jgi:hypothetical protein
MSTPIKNLLRYLDLPAHQEPRLQRLLTASPLAWSELADLGHASPTGKRLSAHWTDRQTPRGFLGVREFLGGRLLLDAWASMNNDDDVAILDPLLSQRPPIRHLRHKLGTELIAAEPVQPWPTLAGETQQLVMLPKGLMELPSTDGAPEAVAAMGLLTRLGEHGISLSWSAWGWTGESWSDGWSARPDHTSAPSRLAWGIVALQHQEPEEIAAGLGQTGVGRIRNPRERPAPCWIEPRRRYVDPDRRAGDGRGGHVAAHWRQAHLHTFLKGPGRQEREQRWLPAIWCAGGQDS